MDTQARWLPILMFIAVLGFWAYSLVDFSRTPEREIRMFTRDTWLLVITFGSVIGCIAWWTTGRPQQVRRR
jgi:hypothetical protein